MIEKFRLKDQVFVALLAYCGLVDIVEVTVSAKDGLVYTVTGIEKNELSELKKQYVSDEGLAVSNIRKFSQTHNYVNLLARNARRTGGWVNADFVRLERDNAVESTED